MAGSPLRPKPPRLPVSLFFALVLDLARGHAGLRGYDAGFEKGEKTSYKAAYDKAYEAATGDE